MYILKYFITLNAIMLGCLKWEQALGTLIVFLMNCKELFI